MMIFTITYRYKHKRKKKERIRNLESYAINTSKVILNNHKRKNANLKATWALRFKSSRIAPAE